MKMHRCNKSGCRNLIPLDEKFCDNHKPIEELKEQLKESEKQQLQSISKGYEYSKDRRTRYAHSYRSQELGHDFYQTSKWRRLSDRVRKRDLYTCQVTGRVQMPHESFVVDHITPRLVDESKAMDESNLWLISRDVHNHKSALERSMTTQQLRAMTRDDWIKLLRD